MGSKHSSKPRRPTRTTPPSRPGGTVYGSDGERIGTVAGVQGHYIVVEKGFILPDDVYVPQSAVERVEGIDVHLHLTKPQVDAEDWSSLQVADVDYSEPDRREGETSLSHTVWLEATVRGEQFDADGGIGTARPHGGLASPNG